MIQRDPKNWRQLKVGLVIVVAIVGLMVAIMNLNEGMGTFTLRSNLVANLDNSQGLKIGAPVRMSGVDVGNVKRINFEPGTARVSVHFTVRSDVRHLLHQDAKVLIRGMGLLGDKYVEIMPGSSQQPFLPEGTVLLGQSDTDVFGVAGSATDALATLNQTLRDMQDILTGLKEGKGTAGKLVTDASLYDRTVELIQKIDTVSQQTTQLLTKVERGDGTLGKMIADRSLYDRATAATEELQKLSVALNRPDGTLGRLARDPTIYQRLENMTTKGEVLIGKIERGDGTLGKLVSQDELYQRADKIITEMETLLKDIQKNPKKYFKFSVF